MNSCFNIFSACLILLSALIPVGLVVCERDDGSISFELKTGDSCSCESVVVDLAEKDCCIDDACHEGESVTAKCHELESQDCNDTEIKAFEIINSQQEWFKQVIKFYVSSSFLVNEICSLDVAFNLNVSSAMGRWRSEPTIIQQVLLFKKSVVFLV